MKKTRVLGVALTLAATMAVGGAMGQMPNYVEIKKATVGTNVTSVDDTAFVQVGLKYGFYAKPDGAFHPSYSASDNTGITLGFSWDWDVVAGITYSGSNKNYVEITAANTPATYKVGVTEKAPAAWGISCAGTSFDFYLASFAAPTFVVGATGDENKKYCGAADAKFHFTITSSGTPHFVYNVEKVAGKMVVGTGAIIADGTYASLTGFPKTVKTFAAADQWTYSVNAGTKTTAVAAGTDGEQLEVLTKMSSKSNKLATYDLTIQRALAAAGTTDPVITIYKITLNQVNGLLSRNADFVQSTGGAAVSETFFPATPSTTESHLVYVVKAPTTGPVYHIGNNKAV